MENRLNSKLARACAAGLALLALGGLAAQFPLTVQYVLDKGGDVFGGVWRFLGFFTITTNALIVIVMAHVALAPRGASFWRSPSVITGATLAIVMVGLVYHFLLSRQWTDLTPFAYWVDRVLHYIVPPLTLAFWFVFTPKAALTWRDPFLWLLYPAGYLAYSMARGAASGTYPYGFIDVGKLGLAGAMINAAGFALGLLLAGLAIVAAARLTQSAQRYSGAPRKAP